VTLARIKEPTALPCPQVFEEIRQRIFGEIHVSEIALFRSELKPSGPLYTVVEKYPLRLGGEKHG
jgi:2'-5' RNA ligase